MHYAHATVVFPVAIITTAYDGDKIASTNKTTLGQLAMPLVAVHN